ncbi:MAG TPA: rhomboid family intramembrane serine protease [Candidatus Angelobacter sp.]|nr:rhomboid family intramembrane serine protease [Candidatus Angelobacter sp.]
MIPIRDDAPKSTTPFINYFLILLNVLVFLFELTLPLPSRTAFELQFAFIPYHVDLWLQGVLPAGNALVPLITSMFLHAGWLHLIFNMWFLAIFGDNVEDRLGHFAYLLFYLVTGLAATATNFAFSLHSRIPSVGASGAIAGVMGAYFFLYPRARVLTWFGFFVFWLPAWLVLGYWFVLQFISGAATEITYAASQNGGVAFWAHVGGFVSGLILIKLVPTRKRYYSFEDY